MQGSEWPQIIHHGAHAGVTGSCHQLLADEQTSYLVDCGLFQGAETTDVERGVHARLAIDFDISTVKALVVTHVHIDHVGRIPWLLDAGFDGPIYCSEPSAQLLPIVLEDAFKLSISRERELVDGYLRLLHKRIVAVPYNQWIQLSLAPGPQVRMRLQRAGHILGSAYVEFELARRAAGELALRVLFSGDLGAPYAPILMAPKPPYRADVLVLESTYGDRLHGNRRNRRQQLKKTIEAALRDQGTVLIPAFSIGRTQEILYELEAILYEAGCRSCVADPQELFTRPHNPEAAPHWEDIPVILDSPLASRFTAAYQRLHEFWDGEARQRLGQGRNPLDFLHLLTVDEHAAHEQMVSFLARTGRPAIVIAGGGMCEGGRIVNYLAAMLEDARHNVLFVGYQAEGTLGRKIQLYGPKNGYVDLQGKRLTIRAGVATVGGYSAHADQAGLLRFVTGMQRWPQQVRLVHGEQRAKLVLQQAIEQKFADKGHPGEVVVASGPG